MRINTKFNVGEKVFVIEPWYDWQKCKVCGHREVAKVSYPIIPATIESLTISISSISRITYTVMGGFSGEVGGCIESSEHMIFKTKIDAKQFIKTQPKEYANKD